MTAKKNVDGEPGATAESVKAASMTGFPSVGSVDEANPAIDIGGLPQGQTAEETARRNFELWPVNDRERGRDGGPGSGPQPGGGSKPSGASGGISHAEAKAAEASGKKVAYTNERGWHVKE